MKIWDLTVFLICIFTYCAAQEYVCQSHNLRDTHRQGGTPVGQYPQDEDCRLYCVNNPRCGSADYDYNTRLCWEHPYGSGDPADNLVNNNCCRHFYMDCAVKPDEDYTHTTTHYHHRSGGNLLTGSYDYSECLAACVQDSVCMSVDWEYDTGVCWIHGSATEEGQLVSNDCCVNWSRHTAGNTGGGEGGEGGDGGDGGSDQQCVVRIVENRHKPGGFRYDDNYPYTGAFSCWSRCDEDPGCLSADWDADDAACWGHATDTDLENTFLRSDSCCSHVFRQCEDVQQTTTAPETTTLPEATTTQRPPTPEPQVNPPLPSNINGDCSSEFKFYPNTQRDRGSRLESAPNVILCRNYCTATDDCVSVDWNKNTRECFMHDLTMAGDPLNDDTCCDHYAKTQCATPQCYAHDTLFVSSDDPAAGFYQNIDGAAQVPGLSVVDCPTNVCFHDRNVFVQQVGGNVQVFLFLTRGCDLTGGAATRTGCHARGNMESCQCVGVKCNGVEVDLLRATFGYYPLDSDATDFSMGRRDGMVLSNQFEMVGSVKNGSAVFRGRIGDAIEILDFSGLTLGYVEDLGDVVSAFAVTVWVYRSDPEGEMVILSNAPPGGASVLIESLPGNQQQHVIRGGYKIGGALYQVSALAPLDSWTMLCLQYYEDTSGPALGLVTTMASVYTNQYDAFIMLPDAARGKHIDYSTERMVIGGQYGSDKYFVGKMDELHFFNDVVTFAQLRALQYPYVSERN